MYQRESFKSKPSRRLHARPSAAPAVGHERWMELHGAIGNRGVLRMLQGRDSDRKTNPWPQARLRTSEPGDLDERKADRVADRSAGSGHPLPTPLAVPQSVNLRRPGGSFVDPRLLGARAYTVGSDVVLGNDVDLGSADGEWILDHELAHVVQAKAGSDSTLRRFVAGDVATQSIGPDYAMQLTDTELEQDIAFLEARRETLSPDSIDYVAASQNLTVLAKEADRRGYKSVGLARGTLFEMFRAVVAQLKRVIDFLPQFRAEFESVSWVIPWRPDPPAWPHNPMDFVHDQFSWMLDALSAAAAMLTLSWETDPEVSFALLRQTGVRISSVMLAFSELRPFLYYLQTAIGIRYIPAAPPATFGGSWLDPVDLARPVENARARVAPDLAALAQLETASIDAVADSSAATTRALFEEIPSYVKRYTSTIKIPQLPWYGEALLLLVSVLLEMPGGAAAGEEGAITLTVPGGMMAGLSGGGAAALTTIVVSAEQIAAIRRLVAIGAISTSVLSAAFGNSLAVGFDLPPALTDLIGEGPTAGAMHATGKTGAGMARQPRHHVMPQEERSWFEERGMTSDLDIDEFTVDMEEAEHQAIHGGGNWRLGRTWPGEWNSHIMDVLRQQEAQFGRRLNPSEILNIVGREMRVYGIPMDFVPFR